MTPQDDAIQILEQVTRDLTSPGHDLKLILRKCQHVCELLGWGTQQSWFYQVLNGYASDVPLPPERNVHGNLIWEVEGSEFDKIQRQSEEMVYGLEPADASQEDTTVEVRAGIDWLMSAAQHGYREKTSETKAGWSRSMKKSVPLQRVKVHAAATFASLIAGIETSAFNFASKAYAQLKYGNALSDIWETYRQHVDTALQQLDFGDHLNAIRSDLQSDNPESWRAAVLECRNLLYDLANYLWLDSRPTYQPLDGRGADGKLEVTQKNYVNRLSAYLHQKGLTRARGKFMRDELERLSTSIRTIVELQSEAHEPIGKDDARSIALATYFIIGELVLRTDMQPITEYAG